MSFQHPFSDLAAGTVAVVGSSAAAVSSVRELRSAGANVRWYCADLDVAEAVLLASAPPGHLELSFGDPLLADYRDFAAIVAGAGGSLDQTIADRARADKVPVDVVNELAPATLNTAAWRKASSREIVA